MINNSAADCSILLNFVTAFDHVTPEYYKCSRSTSVKGQGHSVKTSSDCQIIATV